MSAYNSLPLSFLLGPVEVIRTVWHRTNHSPEDNANAATHAAKNELIKEFGKKGPSPADKAGNTGLKDTLEPPDANKAADDAITSARSAADRMRKRAGAGSTILTGLKTGANPTPTASYTPQSLVGGS